MDINDDGCMVDLINVKCETVICSIRWKDDVHVYAFTSAKGRLDELKIRRLDLKLWKLGTKLSRAQLGSRVVPPHILTWVQLLVS